MSLPFVRFALVSGFAALAADEAAALAVEVAAYEAGRLVIAGTAAPGARVTLAGTPISSTAARPGGAFRIETPRRLPGCTAVVTAGGRSETVEVANCAGGAPLALAAPEASPPPLKPRGTWKSTTSYALNNLVQFQGSTWLARRSSTGRQPGLAANKAYWTLFAARGAQGPAGTSIQGPKGDKGDPGDPGPGAAAYAGGYLVQTFSKHSGNLGGLSGANAICLADLQANNWEGRGDALAQGLLVEGKVRALLCDDAACQNLSPSATYRLVTTGAYSGYEFTTDPTGTDLQFTTEVLSFKIHWSGRSHNAATQTFMGGPNVNTCAGWTDATALKLGRYGNWLVPGPDRYSNDSQDCSMTAALTCIVGP